MQVPHSGTFLLAGFEIHKCLNSLEPSLLVFIDVKQGIANLRSLIWKAIPHSQSMSSKIPNLEGIST